MNVLAKLFGSPSGEPSITTRPMPPQKCEKPWTLPTTASTLLPRHSLLGSTTTLMNRCQVKKDESFIWLIGEKFLISGRPQ